MMTKKIKYFLMFIMLWMNILPVFAEANPNIIDFSKKGSISITFSESLEGTKVSGAEVTIYQIADAYSQDNNLAFSYHSSLKNEQEELENGNISNKVLEFVKENQVLSFQGVTDALGVVSFDQLDLGLYLVTQTNQVSGYSSIDPFLIMIPQVQDNMWIYDITATPKVDIIRLMDLTVEKVWNVADHSEIPNVVTIELLKNEKVINTVVLSSLNDWTYTWSQIEKSDAYSVREVEVPDGYTVTYRQEGDHFIVTNTKSLVQTGRAMWIPPILAFLGLVCIVVGFVLEKRKTYE